MWGSLSGFCDARDEHLDTRMQRIPSLNEYKLYKTIMIMSSLIIYLVHSLLVQLTAPSVSCSYNLQIIELCLNHTIFLSISTKYCRAIKQSHYRP
jgi:hypothetical protein